MGLLSNWLFLGVGGKGEQGPNLKVGLPFILSIVAYRYSNSFYFYNNYKPYFNTYKTTSIDYGKMSIRTESKSTIWSVDIDDDDASVCVDHIIKRDPTKNWTRSTIGTSTTKTGRENWTKVGCGAAVIIHFFRSFQRCLEGQLPTVCPRTPT